MSRFGNSRRAMIDASDFVARISKRFSASLDAVADREASLCGFRATTVSFRNKLGITWKTTAKLFQPACDLTRERVSVPSKGVTRLRIGRSSPMSDLAEDHLD